MSKTYKVRNGLKYMPVKQYNPDGTTKATRIEVVHTSEPDTVEAKSSRLMRFKLLIQDLARGASYAINH